MKKTLYWLATAALAVMLTIMVVPGTAQAETKSGTFNNVSWSFSDDGTLKLSGTGGVFGEDTEDMFEEIGRKNVKKIVIADGITKLDDLAFDECTSLKTVTIGKGVTKILGSAFCNCTSLTTINVDKNNKKYTSVSNVLFTINKKKLVVFPAGKKVSSYAIPSGVTALDDSAFNGCSSIKSLTIPASLTQLYVGSLCECENLASVEFKGSSTNFFTAEDFPKGKKTVIYGLHNSKAETFAYENGYPFRVKNGVAVKTAYYTYDGKTKTPGVVVTDKKGKAISSTQYTVSYPAKRKNIGKYTVKITFKKNSGYTGTRTAVFYIRPAATGISKVSESGTTTKVTWKKKGNVTGYQIAYAPNRWEFDLYYWYFPKNAKIITVSGKSVVSHTFKNQEGYVYRVRTYYKSGSKTYYSGWSKWKPEGVFAEG